MTLREKIEVMEAFERAEEIEFSVGNQMVIYWWRMSRDLDIFV